MDHIPRLELALTLLLVLGCENAEAPTAPTEMERRTGFAITGFDLASVYAGGLYSCGLTKAGKAYCWGKNQLGELGNDNAPTDSDVPIAVAPPAGATTPLTFASLSTGSFHACGLTYSGQAYCWGSNASGQLGDNHASTASAVPVQVVGSIVFVALSTGGSHTCGISTGGQAYCWGRDDGGALGDANPAVTSYVPVAVSPPAGSTAPLTFALVSAGEGLHTCGVVKDVGTAYCWGSNSSGQLGDANTGVDSDLPVAVAPPAGSIVPLTFGTITAGQSHTCAVVKDGGRAYCWGGNSFGELGNAQATVDSDIPVAVAPPAGATTPLSFSSVSAGMSHTCGITKTKGGQAACWGWNNTGQLGNGTSFDIDVPVAVSSASITFASINAGLVHTCGIAKGKGAWCWGDNEFGQLGNDQAPVDNSAPSPVRTP